MLSDHIRAFLGGDSRPLDAYLQRRRFPAHEKEAVDDLFRINTLFSTAPYPIGIGNPAAEASVREVLRTIERKSASRVTIIGQMTSSLNAGRAL